MQTQELATLNKKIATLNASSKVQVDCLKKNVKALKGQMSLKMCGMIDHLKKVGMRVQFVESF